MLIRTVAWARMGEPYCGYASLREATTSCGGIVRSCVRRDGRRDQTEGRQEALWRDCRIRRQHVPGEDGFRVCAGGEGQDCFDCACGRRGQRASGEVSEQDARGPWKGSRENGQCEPGARRGCRQGKDIGWAGAAFSTRNECRKS